MSRFLFLTVYPVVVELKSQTNQVGEKSDNSQWENSDQERTAGKVHEIKMFLHKFQ